MTDTHLTPDDAIPTAMTDENAVQIVLSQFVCPHTIGIALLGSRARGEHGPYSDVDVLRILGDDTGSSHTVSCVDKCGGTHFVHGQYFVICDAEEQEAHGWLKVPSDASSWVQGLRIMKPIHGEAVVEKLQRAAVDFTWTEDLITKSYESIADDMVGWIEEAQKGLEGLRRGGGIANSGRLLNAKHGLTFGLANVMIRYLGLLTRSDNSFLDELFHVLLAEPEEVQRLHLISPLPSKEDGMMWVSLCRTAFGIIDDGSTPPTLDTSVRAGLRLFVLTATIVEPALRQHQRQRLMIHELVSRIQGTNLST